VLEKDIKDQLIQSCKKMKKYYIGSRRKEHSTYSKKQRKANLSGHILCRNYLLKHIIEGKIEEMGRRCGRLM